LKKRKFSNSPDSSPPGKLQSQNTKSLVNKKSQKSQAIYNCNTGRFDILRFTETDQSNLTVQQQNPRVEEKHYNTPPIVLHRFTDIKKLRNVIEKKIAPNDYIIALGRHSTVCIKPKTMVEYKSIIHLLKDEGLSGYTFTPKSEMPFRIVIKGIHPSTDIESEIVAAGHQIHGLIVAARHRGQKDKLLPIHFVSLKKAENNDSIYDIQYLCNHVVKIEPPHKVNTMIQCQRCQAYGHSKVNCFEKPVCVKCSGPHLTTECEKGNKIARDELCCALCNEKHPANYQGCSVYKDIIERRKKLKKTPNVQAAQEDTAPHSQILPKFPLPRQTEVTRPRKTYSEATNRPSEEPTTNQDTLLNNFIMQQTSLFQQVLTQLTMLTTAINKLVAKLSNE